MSTRTTSPSSKATLPCASSPGTPATFLEHAGALTADLVISLLAKRQFTVPRVAARVNDAENTWLFDRN
jgi:Trk K+ transport system NAD-binding subunit